MDKCATPYTITKGVGSGMLTFDEAAAMLDDIVDELPAEFFKDLNGGVYLHPDTREHPESVRRHPLYILGEYIHRYHLGKYINLYYGSIIRVYRHLPPHELRSALRRIIIHEFTHHIEFLAGERGLEIKDGMEMEQYLRGGNATAP